MAIEFCKEMECNKLDLTDIVICNILVEGLGIGQIFESALDLFCGQQKDLKLM